MSVPQEKAPTPPGYYGNGKEALNHVFGDARLDARIAAWRFFHGERGGRVTDEELAARLAEGAGKLLMELRRSRFLEGRAMGIVGDKVSNAFILLAPAVMGLFGYDD